MNPHYEEYDTTNTIAPKATTVNLVKKMIFPPDFSVAESMNYKQPKAEDIYGVELREIQRLNQPVTVSSGRTTGNPPGIPRISEINYSFMPPGYGVNTPKSGAQSPSFGITSPMAGG